MASPDAPMAFPPADPQTDPMAPSSAGPPPPTATDPSGSLPRNPWGWIVLVLLFGLMISTAVAASFRRVETDSAAALKPAERQLESFVSLRSATRAAETSLASGIAGESAEKGLADLARDLRTEAPREPRAALPRAALPRAALLRALVARERGKSPRPEDLALAARISGPSKRQAKVKQGALDETADEASPPDLRPAARLVAEARPKSPPVLSPKDPFLLRLAAAQARERAGLPPAEARRGLVAPGYLERTALLSVGTLAAVALALVAWVGYAVAQGSPAVRTRGLPSLPMRRAEADRFLLRAALMLLAFLLLTTLVGAVGGGLVGRLGLPKGTVTGASLAVYVGIAAYALRLPKDRLVPNLSWRGLRIDGRELGPRVLWGVAAAVANLPILLGVTLLSARLFRDAPPPSHPATELLTNNPSFVAVALTFVLASICAPIWEEVLFRGLLFQGFSGAFGGSNRAVLGSALLSSFLFASIHPQGPAGWAGLMTIALMSCALVRKTGSLVPSMVMHATHNTLTLAAALLAGPILGSVSR